MTRIGIIGASGYTGEETAKIVARHPKVKLTYLAATSDKPEDNLNIFPNAKGASSVPCEKLDYEKAIAKCDLIFLALPHKASMEVAPIFLSAGKMVVDLSADYRLDATEYETWYGVEHKDASHLPDAVYGLPELFKGRIAKSSFIANPGCYPTSAILGIAPMLHAKLVDIDSIIVDSKSGASGAGKKLDTSLLFNEVNENLKAYKVNEHQHKPEINKILSLLAKKPVDIVFTPHLIPMTRGILSTIYLRLKKKSDTTGIIALYEKFYSGKPFVRISREGKLPQTKDVTGTNFCDIGMKVTGDIAIIISCIDNLRKGAAGQAVQNMNIMLGLDETEGLL